MKRWVTWSYVFLAASVVLVPLALHWDFNVAPTEASMGHAQRIFYLHLPMWAVCYSAYTGAFVFSVLYLLKRSAVWDHLAAGWVEVGLVFNSMGLLSGMIWGKYAWGSWWQWDPRLTATFIMWFLYVGYMLLRYSIENPNARARMCAILSVVSFLDIPIIMLSVRLWRGIHPNVIKGPNQMQLDPVMQQALLISIFAFWLVGLAILAVRSGLALAEMKVVELRVEESPPGIPGGGGEAKSA